METYDFDKIIPRNNTNCAKWDLSPFLFGETDVIPMWVADMDLPVAKPIIEALKKRLEHEIFGYSVPIPYSTLMAVVNRMKRNYDWDVKPEWIVATPGVVPAMHNAVRAFTNPGDAVVHQEPVYYHFHGAIEGSGCQRASNELILRNGRYGIDYADLASKFEPKMGMYPTPSRAKMLMLCNPHNPVGRVWTREELAKMGEIAISNDAVVVSNEIHCEVLFKGHQHIPFASISEEFEQNSVVCMAPSKTFNVAGLEASVIIIPNDKLRKRFEETRSGILPKVNVMGLVALEAAYDKGDVWLEQFLDYLQGNYEFLAEYIKNRIPSIKVIEPEGTYLIWLDCRKLGMNPEALKEFMNHKARVGLDHGFVFGSGGAGFERMNIACPRATLEEALKRIEKAVNELGK